MVAASVDRSLNKKDIIKETDLGLCSTFHFICTNCSAISILKSSDTFSKEVNSGRRKPYAVNVKAAFGKYALCVYTLCLSVPPTKATCM